MTIVLKCLLDGKNNGTTLNWHSQVNCFTTSSPPSLIASCKKHILSCTIIAQLQSLKHQHLLCLVYQYKYVLAHQMCTGIFSLQWETLFCSGLLRSIEGFLQTCPASLLVYKLTITIKCMLRLGYCYSKMTIANIVISWLISSSPSVSHV